MKTQSASRKSGSSKGKSYQSKSKPPHKIADGIPEKTNPESSSATSGKPLQGDSILEASNQEAEASITTIREFHQE